MAVGSYEIARKLALSGKGPLGLTGKYLKYYKELRLALIYRRENLKRLMQKTEKKNTINKTAQQQKNIQEKNTPQIFKRGTTISTDVKGFFQEKANTSDINDIDKQPYIRQRATGEYIHGVPVVEYEYINPRTHEIRKATPAEEKYFEQIKHSNQVAVMNKQEQNKNILRKSVDRITRIQQYQNIAGRYAAISREPFIGTENEKAYFRQKTVKTLRPVVGETASQYVAGAASSVIPWTKGELIKDVAVVGASSAAGAALRFGEMGAVSLSEKSAIIPKLYKVGEVAGGTYLTAGYIGSRINEISSSKNNYHRGEIIGESIKDVSLVGFGFMKGRKYADIIAGKKAVSGRIEIPIEKISPREIIEKKITFPKTNTVQEEYSAFAKNKYSPPIKRLKNYGASYELVYPEEYSALPVKIPSSAYHVTPTVFWRNGKIIPKPETSELPGLFASYTPSFYFSKIGGERFLPKSIKDFFSLSLNGVPGIANIQPKEFRINPAIRVEPYTIEGSKQFKLSFKYPVKEGVADIPLNKLGGESQAIFRVGSGEYRLINKEYYVTYENVPLRIDQFRYGENIKEPVIKRGKKVAESYKKIEYDYSIPRYSAVNIQSISLTSLYERSAYSQGRYKNKTKIPIYKKGSITNIKIKGSIKGKATSKLITSSIKINSIKYIDQYRKSSYKAKLIPSINTPKIPSISSPKIPSISSPKIPSINTPKIPSISSPKIPSINTPKIPSINTPIVNKRIILTNKPFKTIKKSSFRIPVLVRRRGKFRVVGYGKNPLEAIKIGKSIVGKTLARTFTIPKMNPIRVKGFKTKKEKKGIVFIEPSKKALNTPSEIKSIQIARRYK